MEFAVPTDHRVKIKESEKRGKYLDLSWELRKLCNMKETVIPIIIGTLGTVTKGLQRELEKLEIRGRIETILSIVLLRSSRILRKVLETRWDLLSLRLLWKSHSKSKWGKTRKEYDNNPLQTIIASSNYLLVKYFVNLKCLLSYFAKC